MRTKRLLFLKGFFILICLSLLQQVSFAQNVTVSGTVTDTVGTPLPSVSVSVQGTNTGTTTNTSGHYSISAPVNSVLIFSFVGFRTAHEVATEGTLNVRLEPASTTTIDEVVVVAYGTQKKANLTGAVSSVSAKSLESRPVANTGQALQGLIPGLNLSTAGMGGELNQNLAVNIRGGGTIGSGSNSAPLVLIDGMAGDMNALNIQDIESISVLKDAGSAAIYGSRAPFGVILITTKKGRSGKATINYNNNLRWTSPLGLPKMLDSYRFALYWNEAAQNDGEGAKFSQDMLDKILAYQKGTLDSGTTRSGSSLNWPMYTGSNANTDWFKEQYKSAAFAQDHNLSASGGSEKSQYYVSANYLDQGGLSRHGNDHFNRYTVTGKINSQLSNYVRFDYTSRFVREDYKRAAHMFDLYYHNIARRWPTVPVRTPDGKYYSDASEIAQLEDGGVNRDQQDWIYQQGKLTITPRKGWNIVADANYRINNYNNHQEILPAYSGDVLGRPVPLSVGWNSAGYTYVYEYARKENYFASNIYSDYAFKIRDKHDFKALIGFNSELNKYRTLGGSRSGLITPLVPTINTATNESKATEGQYQHWATAGFFGRLNYNYLERYLVEVNARYDGSSRFLKDQRWNLFPSVSVGWNVAKENFWPSGWDIQNFKLRASYGELGNQNTSNWYPFYLTQPFNVATGSWLLNGDKTNTAYAPGLISTLLTWERVTSRNFGLDISALRNRFTVNADYFVRKTLDMVGPAPELPVILGTSVPNINNTDMKSWGFEVEAIWKDRIGDFGYSVRGVLADDQQEVTNYPNPTGNIGTWYSGRKSGEIWGYTTIGIAKTQEEMDAHLATTKQNAMGSNWKAGDIMYKDINGDGKIDGGAGVLGNTGDRTIIGNSTPRYRYSLDLGADWKGFDLRVFLQGVGKRDWMPNGPYFWGATGGMWQSAGFDTHMDYFRDENSVMVKAGMADVNKDAYFARPYFNTGKNQYTQTRYLQNAAYLRVKNIQLGYTLPQQIVSKLTLSKIRLYASAENILTFTKMIKTFDPETVGLSGWNDGKTYPLGKIVSLGLSVNF
jgi:TonB-linked SusC/RagA family outer membrane protein